MACLGCGGSSTYSEYINYDPCNKPVDCNDPCEENCDKGCEQLLDTKCIISKDALESIGSSEGDNLETILEKMNDKLSSVNPLVLEGISFGYLGEKYQINSFKQFAEAVVQELTILKQSTNNSGGTVTTCSTFTVKNTGTTMGYYNVRDCNGNLSTSVMLSAGGTIVLTARGVLGVSSNILVTNNGVL